MEICKLCLFRQAKKCYGVFSPNGCRQESSDYCQDCLKQIIFYFLNCNQNEQEDVSFDNIRKIIQEKNYQNGLLVADTSIFSDKEIDKFHNEINKLSKNVYKYEPSEECQNKKTIVLSQDEMILFKEFFVFLTGDQNVCNSIVKQYWFDKCCRVGYLKVIDNCFIFDNVIKSKVFKFLSNEDRLLLILVQLYRQLIQKNLSVVNFEKLVAFLKLDLNSIIEQFKSIEK